MSRTVTVGDDAVAIAARASGQPGELTVTVGDRHLRVTVARAGDGSLRITRDDGRAFSASVSRDGTDLWVTTGGVTSRVREAVVGRDARGGGGGLEAPMPGKVLRVLCHPGERVARGATLIIVEAMKMEHAIKAPRDGVVAEVMAAEGALVGAGAVLVRLADAEAPAEVGEGAEGAPA